MDAMARAVGETCKKGASCEWCGGSHQDCAAGIDGTRLCVHSSCTRGGFTAAGDNACGASDASTLAMSTPGFAQLSTPSEGDDSGGAIPLGSSLYLRGMQAGSAAAAASSSPSSKAASVNIGAQMWQAVGGDDALNGRAGRAPDRQVAGVLGNLKSLLLSNEIWQIRHSDDKQVQAATASRWPSAATAADRAAGGGGSPLRPQAMGASAASPSSILSSSPSKAPNFAEAAVEALAAAKRAEASRVVVERLAEERLIAERILVERLQTEGICADRLNSEQLEGTRLSAERMVAAVENERVLNERLQRCEAREAFCEQQVAAEQSRVVLLKAELDASRRMMECRDKDTNLAEAMKVREVHHNAKTQCLESMHEDARREIEALRLQHQLAEVDLGRSKTELAATNTRQKVLEEELRLLKERPPKAGKTTTQRRAANGKLLDRYDLASRTAFASQANPADADQLKAQNQKIHEGSPSLEAAGKGVNGQPEQKGGWFWGCCSTERASPSGPINSNAPERPTKPNA